MHRFAKWEARQTGAQVAVFVLVLCIGFVFGFYYATGDVPFMPRQSAAALVPLVDVQMSASETQDTIAPLQDRQYGQGYNCIDYAWEGMRLLQWQGVQATIVRLSLDPPPHHAVLLVPTGDKGWIFIEPQTGKEITPREGGKVASGQTITAIHVLYGVWEPLAHYSPGAWSTGFDEDG